MYGCVFYIHIDTNKHTYAQAKYTKLQINERMDRRMGKQTYTHTQPNAN